MQFSVTTKVIGWLRELELPGLARWRPEGAYCAKAPPR
jgi:hypothetical protein